MTKWHAGVISLSGGKQTGWAFLLASRGGSIRRGTVGGERMEKVHSLGAESGGWKGRGHIHGRQRGRAATERGQIRPGQKG